MKKIDCLGEACPIPLLLLKDEIPSIQAGEPVMLITDHSCTCRSIREFCAAKKLRYLEDEVLNGVWELTISR